MVNIDELEKLAREATPGPWHVANGNQIRGERDQIAKVWMMRAGEGNKNAALIATANPSAILDLIASCRKAEEEVENLKSAVSHEADVAESYKAEADELKEAWSRNTGLLTLLNSIASVAHCGGLSGMSESEALSLIRKVTLVHFDSAATDNQHKAAINSIKEKQS